MDAMTLPPEYSDETRYKMLESGAVYDRQIGRIVANPGGKYNISQANSGELRALWKQKQARARLRGLVRGVTDADGKAIDVSDIPDELIQQAQDAAEALTAHLVRTFMSSKNLRGMGETYTRLLGLDDKSDDTQQAQTDTVRAVADLVAHIMQYVRPGSADVVDAVAQDTGVGGGGDGVGGSG